jgi:hypothetical protein
VLRTLKENVEGGKQQELGRTFKESSRFGCGTIAEAREFVAGVPKMSYYHGHNNAVVPVCVCLPGPVEILFDLQPCTALPDHEKRT